MLLIAPNIGHFHDFPTPHDAADDRGGVPFGAAIPTTARGRFPTPASAIVGMRQGFDRFAVVTARARNLPTSPVARRNHIAELQIGLPATRSSSPRRRLCTERALGTGNHLKEFTDDVRSRCQCRGAVVELADAPWRGRPTPCVASRNARMHHRTDRPRHDRDKRKVVQRIVRQLLIQQRVDDERAFAVSAACSRPPVLSSATSCPRSRPLRADCPRSSAGQAMVSFCAMIRHSTSVERRAETAR